MSHSYVVDTTIAIQNFVTDANSAETEVLCRRDAIYSVRNAGLQPGERVIPGVEDHWPEDQR